MSVFDDIATALGLAGMSPSGPPRRRRVAEEPRADRFDHLPRPGTRWKRDPDGTWHRWSYLGEVWEPQPQPPTALQETAAASPSTQVWVEDADGSWTPGTMPEQQPTLRARIGTTAAPPEHDAPSRIASMRHARVLPFFLTTFAMIGAIGAAGLLVLFPFWVLADGVLDPWLLKISTPRLAGPMADVVIIAAFLAAGATLIRGTAGSERAGFAEGVVGALAAIVLAVAGVLVARAV